MQSPLYFIAILPPIHLREKVRDLKFEIQSRYGSAHALKSPAHITLQMPFRLPSEEGIIASLKKFAASQKSFDIKLEGFDSFPPRVIFIKVGNHQPVSLLQKELSKMLSDEDYIKPANKFRPFHPHMTIATRDLTEANFQAAWPTYKERSFSDTFTTSSLFLLKHNGATWDIHWEFAFGK